jgi:hypothetical protein
MRFLYLTIKFFPYWAIPTGLILIEVAMILRRRGNRKGFIRMLTAASFVFIVTILFFVFRWDMTLYPLLQEHIFPRP